MRGLVSAVLQQGAGHDYLLIVPPDAEHLLPASNGRCRILPSRVKYYSIREQFALPAVLRQHKIDLLHSPHFLIPLLCPCPAVITIHDVIYLACAGDLPSRVGHMYYRWMIQVAARRAASVVTDSEYSKQDIVRYLGTDPAKIQVVYLGVDEQFAGARDTAGIDSVRNKYGIRREFVFYAGICKPRKNHEGLFRAFRELVSSGVDADLVIAGPMADGETGLRRLAAALGIAERVIFTGFVDDRDLRLLYAAARVYACPSLYEGFGFTVLEAMAAGVPVVSSRETSLPEVAGSAALYADARDPLDFAAALRRAFLDDDLRCQLIAAGHANTRRFSWQDAARRMLSIYEHTFSTLAIR